jgi:hypothetical protein
MKCQQSVANISVKLVLAVIKSEVSEFRSKHISDTEMSAVRTKRISHIHTDGY